MLFIAIFLWVFLLIVNIYFGIAIAVILYAIYKRVFS